jgi:hypothetical protein
MFVFTAVFGWILSIVLWVAANVGAWFLSKWICAKLVPRVTSAKLQDKNPVYRHLSRAGLTALVYTITLLLCFWVVGSTWSLSWVLLWAVVGAAIEFFRPAYAYLRKSKIYGYFQVYVQDKESLRSLAGKIWKE